VLVLAALRLAWRWSQGVPKLPKAMPGWQVKSSHISHWLLYLSLFLLPISGWLMSSASAYSVSWFGLFTWPDLIAPDKALRSTFASIHDNAAKVLFVIALLHIAAAIKHHWVDKDSVLTRMTGWASMVLFASVIVVGITALTPSGDAQSSDAGQPTLVTTTPSNDTTAAQRPSTTGDLPAWQIDYSQSTIAFTAEQAGANFTGEWRDWQATLMFDREALEKSRFDVTVQIDGVDTKDDERDATLKDAEWFNAEAFPAVQFVASRFSQNTDGTFIAASEMIVKGERYPLEFTFEVERDGNTVSLTGSARIDRLAMNIGTGDWTDTEWVGQFVDVAVTVTAVTE
ncbi:MAG: YceI family protein, partial [Pseudomonadota bacterium]